MALENNPYPQDVRVRSEAEELVAAGHDVTVLAPRGAGQLAVETVGGVRVKRYRLPSASGAAGLLVEYAIAVVQLSARLAAELARGAEVVHLHNPPDFLFGVGALARALGRAVVFDHHDLAPELFEQKFASGGLPVRLLRWCELLTMRVANVVIAANESHRRVALGRGGVDDARVVVVRNAPRAATLVAHASGAAGGTLPAPRLCYVGSLASQDGVGTLPEIVARLLRRGLSPRLTIVGEGPERAPIERRVRELGLADRVELLGHVPHERVPRILASSDICLDVAPCTPLNDQSTMIKIGEYLAAARPIVSYPLRETRHTAGDCALYAECGDVEAYCEAIVRLCEDAALRARLSADGLERARELTWERSAERLRHGYSLASDAVASRRRGRVAAGLAREA